MPRGNEKFSIPLSPGGIQPQSPPPSRQKVHTCSRGYYCTLHSPSPNVVDSKFVKYPSVVIVRGKTIPARWPFFLSLRPRRRSNMMMRTIFARIHCNFRRMFPFRSFFAESELRKNICRIFADSINVAQNTHKRYRRPKIVRFVCSNHVTSRGRLIRVAVEQKRHLFRKFLGRVSRSCRVRPMPYETV